MLLSIPKKIINRLRWEHYKYLVDHNPRKVLDKIWLREFGYTVNWEKPRDLNEKIEWLICYGDTSKWPMLADKYRVREYVTQKGLGHLLPQLYGVWNNAYKIDFSKLPDKFVLKCNHDCGSYQIVNKKEEISKEIIVQNLNNHLKYKFGYRHCEPHYNKIKPLIIAEEYLESTKDSFSSSLVDYKVWCFEGKPYCIYICYNRDSSGIDTNIYDLNWNDHADFLLFTNHFRYGREGIPKPLVLEEMLNAASILSQDLLQARVDFYIVDDMLKFGEITLTSSCGRMKYFTKEYLIELGNQVRIHS